MVKIVFVDNAGKEQVVEAASGTSLMEVARDNGVEGIEADCGGGCSCATCIVHIAPDWYERLQLPQDLELDMLEMAPQRGPFSRLACQIPISDELDGLSVELPK